LDKESDSSSIENENSRKKYFETQKNPRKDFTFLPKTSEPKTITLKS
jgi:hypothetical protein